MEAFSLLRSPWLEQTRLPWTASLSHSVHLILDSTRTFPCLRPHCPRTSSTRRSGHVTIITPHYSPRPIPVGRSLRLPIRSTYFQSRLRKAGARAWSNIWEGPQSQASRILRGSSISTTGGMSMTLHHIIWRATRPERSWSSSWSSWGMPRRTQHVKRSLEARNTLYIGSPFKCTHTMSEADNPLSDGLCCANPL